MWGPSQSTFQILRAGACVSEKHKFAECRLPVAGKQKAKGKSGGVKVIGSFNRYLLPFAFVRALTVPGARPEA